MNIDLYMFLREPTPVIVTKPLKAEGHGHLDSVSVLVGPVTKFRAGGDEIDDPKHGDTGWCHEELLIYNSVYGLEGWYKVRDYQVLKALCTGSPDWRVMPGHFYEGRPGGYSSIAPVPSSSSPPRSRVAELYRRVFG
jgi:hypothetical protein